MTPWPTKKKGGCFLILFSRPQRTHFFNPFFRPKMCVGLTQDPKLTLRRLRFSSRLYWSPDPSEKWPESLASLIILWFGDTICPVHHDIEYFVLRTVVSLSIASATRLNSGVQPRPRGRIPLPDAHPPLFFLRRMPSVLPPRYRY